ncbi:MAG: acetoacetate decarboxylase family protein [Candidatus Geothermincolia bacterium]
MIYTMERSQMLALAKREMVVKFVGAEMLIALYRTDPEVIRAILPRPLEPLDEPLAMAFLASYPETNFGITYNEGGLFILCRCRGEIGGYCLSMPVTDDMAMAAGREHVGFPKKLAEEISLVREGDTVSGRVVRKGHEILNISCQLTEPAGLPDLTRYVPSVSDLEGKQSLKMISFLYKYFLRPDAMGFDFVPRLIRLVTLFRPRPGQMKGPCEVMVSSSPNDPLGEVPVREVVQAIYGVWDNDILLGRVVGRAWNLPSFLPHALWKSDYLYNFPENGAPDLTWRERFNRFRTIRSY